MSETGAAAERREQILGELAEGLHAVFKEAQQRTMQAEDDAAFVGLSATLCNIARGVRQCVGWHAKLERERRTFEAETAAEAADARAEAVLRRKARLAGAVGPRLATAWPEPEEFDEDDNEAFNEHIGAFNARLDDLSEDDDFLDQDPDVLIAKLCDEFGVTAPQPPAPRVPAKAETRADAPMRAPPWPRRSANGHDPHPADTS